jgi:hypothetical protein
MRFAKEPLRRFALVPEKAGYVQSEKLHLAALAAPANQLKPAAFAKQAPQLPRKVANLALLANLPVDMVLKA